MKYLNLLIVSAPLMLAGASPAIAQSDTAPRSDATVELAVAGSIANRESYTQKARAEMREWDQKLHAYSEQAEAKVKAADKAMEHDLNEAWYGVEASANRLEIVGNESWESAKDDYQKAAAKLAAVWHRKHPQSL